MPDLWEQSRLSTGSFEGAGCPDWRVEDCGVSVPGEVGDVGLHLLGVHPDHGLDQGAQGLEVVVVEVPQHVVPDDRRHVVPLPHVLGYELDVVHEEPGGGGVQLGTLAALAQAEDLVTPDVKVAAVPVHRHHLVDHVPVSEGG